MKQKISKCILLISLLFTSVFYSQTIEATSYVSDIPYLFENMYVVDKQSSTQSFIGYIYVNGELSYCIEPLKIIGSNIQMTPSSILPQEMSDRLSILAYFGYGENRKSEKWYAATQIVIWETLGYQQKVYGFDDYPKYRKEILDGVASFRVKPSFDATSITLKKGESKTILDLYNVLASFELNDKQDDDLLVQKQGNELIVTAKTNVKKEWNIKLRKAKDADIGVPIIYVGRDDKNVQALIRTKLRENVNASLKVRTQPYGELIFTKTAEKQKGIQKTESDFGDLYTFIFETDYLAGTLVELYAREDIIDVDGKVLFLSGTLVDTLESKDFSIRSQPLPSGSYYVKEVASGNEYVLDTKEYDFQINDDSTDVEEIAIDYENERSKVIVKIAKTIEEHPYYTPSEIYKDIVFGIYTNDIFLNEDDEEVIGKDQLVAIVPLDENGKAQMQIDLPFGKYYIKELRTNINYTLDSNKYEFEVYGVNEEEIVISFVDSELENQLKRFRLSLQKVDQDTGNALIADFILYNRDMEEIQRFQTDKDGFYQVDGLINGSYFIKEVRAPDSYEINENMVDITINGKDEKILLKNRRKPLVKTYDGTNIKKAILFGFLSLFILVSLMRKRVFLSK